jgi:hypothetical protein
MAWRFDASTDTIIVPGFSGATATILIAAKRVVDLGNYSNVWIVHANSGGTGSTRAGLGTDVGGDTMTLFDSAFLTQTGPTMTTGTWYYFAAVMSSTSWTLYYGTNPASLTTVGPNTRTALSSPGSFTLGDATEWWSGDMANLKVYTRALTLSECQAELATASVVDSTSLIRHHTMDTVTMVPDAGSAGTNMTAGSTAVAAVTGPYSTTITGALAGSAPQATGALAATQKTNGALAGTAPQATGAVAGIERTNGAVAGSAPVPTGALVATQKTLAALAGAVAQSTGALVATQRTAGAVAGSAPVAVGGLPATQTDPGAVAGSVPQSTGALAGALVNPAVFAGSAPHPTIALVGDLPGMARTGTVAGVAPSATGALTGTAPVVGAFAGSAPHARGDLTNYAVTVWTRPPRAGAIGLTLGTGPRAGGTATIETGPAAGTSAVVGTGPRTGAAAVITT